jgi:arsenite transporter
MAIVRLLELAARHGKALLVVGLVAGIALPELANALKPHIGAMVAILLFLAALRVGPRQAAGSMRDVGRSAGLALILQLAFPVLAILAFLALGWSGPVALGLILMLSAPPVSGSPNLTIMTGNDPSAALRQLVVGTSLLPLTVIPVFWLWPDLGGAQQVLAAAAGLLALIAVAAGAGFALRATALRHPSARSLQSIDGVSAVVMGVVVIGLMSAVGPALIGEPGRVAAMLAAAFAANLALQIVMATIYRQTGNGPDAAAVGIVAGNRNIALFLTVLPQETIDPVLLFIGCYQIPMYLTPTVLGRFYRP